MAGLFSVSYMGCHPNPIDELIFFRRGRYTTNHMWFQSTMAACIGDLWGSSRGIENPNMGVQSPMSSPDMGVSIKGATQELHDL